MKYNVNSFVLNNQILKYFIENNDPDLMYYIKLEEIPQIRDYAFYKKGYLRSITIPKSVKYIGEKAFSGCLNLTTISYEGTIEEFKKIEFGNQWNYQTGFLKIQCIDGNISKEEV